MFQFSFNSFRLVASYFAPLRQSRKYYDSLAVIGFFDKHKVMELRHLRYFVGVALHLNYSAVAAFL
jgi:hypothetical protein